MMLPSILKGIFYTEWKAAPSNSLLDSYLIHFISGFSSTLRFTKKKKDSWHFVSFFIHACIPTSSHISSLRYSNPCYDRIEPYTKSPFMATLHWYLFLRQKLNWTCLTLQFAFPLSQQQDWQDWGTDRWNVTSSLNAPLGGEFRVKGEKEKKKKESVQPKCKPYLLYMPDKDSYHPFLWKEACFLRDRFCTGEELGCVLFTDVKVPLVLVAWMPNYL